METTNTFLNGQITGPDLDARGDLYKIEDHNRDFTYMQGKIAQAIKGISSLPNIDFLILYGGQVSDGGSGTINISEGLAIGKNVVGDTRFIFIPELTGVTIPSGWNDDRQIWVIGQHAWKLGSSTRTHRTVNNEQYNYTVEDIYAGESKTDDLFVDSDPSETVVCWGSFQMNGTVFCTVNGRSNEFILSNKKINVDLITEKTTDNGVLIEGERVSRYRTALLELSFLGLKIRDPDNTYSNHFQSITYGNGLFVAVGYGGEIQTSPDGVTWTHRNNANSYVSPFSKVIYGNGLFVVIGYDAEIQTSTDGIRWYQRLPYNGYTGDFYVGFYMNGTFYIGGSNAELQTSSDGTTWTKVPTATGYTNTFSSMAYGNGRYVLGGFANEIQTSPDGENWTRLSHSMISNFLSITYTGSKFIASDGVGNVYVSSDGLSWVSYSLAGKPNSSFQAIIHCNGLVVGVGSNGIQTSPDGMDWTDRDLRDASGCDYHGAVYGQGRFIFVGSLGGIDTTERITLP